MGLLGVRCMAISAGHSPAMRRSGSGSGSQELRNRCRVPTRLERNRYSRQEGRSISLRRINTIDCRVGRRPGSPEVASSSQPPHLRQWGKGGDRTIPVVFFTPATRSSWDLSPA